jgi:molybdenum cofactor cytidylyltransferase
MRPFSVVILVRPFSVLRMAAGASSRLGRPKQLVELGGVTLIRRAVSVALAAEPREVIVALGAYAAEVKAAMGDLPAKVVFNERWQEGMGSSIRAGVEAVDPSSEAVVLMLCDQLHVDVDLLRTLVEKISDEVETAASEYDGQAGVPCAFRRSVIPELLKLEGDLGARNIIRDPQRHVVLVPFESAGVDIDTQEDVEAAIE